MLAIILNILKVLGIILLCLLGIALCLILAVLFVPVRYKAEGEYRDGYWVKGRMSWLLHIVMLTVQFSDEKPLMITVRLFGIPIIRLPKQSAKQESLKPELDQVVSRAKQTDAKTEITGAEKKTEKKEQDLQATEEHEIEADEKPEFEAAKQEAIDVEEQEVEEESSAHKLTLFEKIKFFVAKIRSYFHNIGYTIQKIYDNIVNIKRNINYYVAVFQSEETKSAFLLCKKQLLRIWHDISPKKFQIFVHFGIADSPDMMGQILAVWGMLYPFHQGNIAVEADFEKTVLEGSFLMKGYTSVYVYMWTLYLVLFDKNIKKFRQSFNREEK